MSTLISYSSRSRRKPFWVLSKAVAQASSSHVDFATPGPSYCDNPPSGLFLTSALIVNHLLFSLYIFMKSGAFVWTFATDYVRSSHSKLAIQMCGYTSGKSVIIQLSERESAWGNRVFVCIETLINCSKVTGFILIIERFFFNESLNYLPHSCPFSIQTEWFKLPNAKSASFDSWTNKGLNVLIRQPQTILYLEEKKDLP